MTKRKIAKEFKKKGEVTFIKTPYPTFLDKIKPNDHILFKLKSLDDFPEGKEPFIIPNLANRELVIGKLFSGIEKYHDLLNRIIGDPNAKNKSD